MASDRASSQAVWSFLGTRTLLRGAKFANYWRIRNKTGTVRGFSMMSYGCVPTARRKMKTKLK